MIRRTLRWVALCVGLTLTVLMLAWPVAAQQTDGVVVRVASVDDSNFPTVSAVFTADEGGRPLANLTAAQVAVVESGSTGEVLGLQAAESASMPLALVVTFDTSGSMAGANLVQSKAAATALFRSLSTNDIGALITFSDSVNVAVPLPGTPASLEAAVAGLQANGNTALYDAVAQSGRVAAASGVQRRAVVLFSDGEDFGGRSAISREQSLQEAASGQALFYVIGIGQQVDRAYLEELATRSGGRYFQAPSAAEVPAIYASIEDFLRGQYLVTFRSNAAADIQARALQLTITLGTRTGAGQLSYQSQRQAPTPVAPTPTTTVPTPAPAVTQPTPSPEESSDGVPAWRWVFVPALLVGAAGAWLIRRRKGRVEAPQRTTTPGPLPGNAPLEQTASKGVLTVARGAEVLQSLQIDGRPVTIGAGGDCDLRLTDPQLEGTELRLWWRDGSAMAHVLKERGVVPLLNGAPFRWASVKDGDELQLGPYSLRYSGEEHANGR